MRVGRPVKPMPQPYCPYCNAKAKLLRQVDAGYPYQADYGPTWTCVPCKAWVGCHANSTRHAPLGRLADAELRQWKMKVHDVFDPLWQRKMRRDACNQFEARNAGYKWLAGEMGLEIKRCHVGEFDIEECKRAIEIITTATKRRPSAA
jgi:hypothetical protein